MSTTSTSTYLAEDQNQNQRKTRLHEGLGGGRRPGAVAACWLTLVRGMEGSVRQVFQSTSLEIGERHAGSDWQLDRIRREKEAAAAAGGGFG